MRPSKTLKENRQGDSHGEWSSLNGHDLPVELKPLFWEYDFESLSWKRDNHFITKRILTHGGLWAWDWLRDRIGDVNLRDWILENNGVGMEPRRLRYWELVLDLPTEEVNRWIALEANSTWGRRRQQLQGSAA
jgi:hypothetical protein